MFWIIFIVYREKIVWDLSSKLKNSTYRISYKDILYFQSTGRKINIVMKKEIRTFYGKLNEIEKRIQKMFF